MKDNRSSAPLQNLQIILLTPYKHFSSLRVSQSTFLIFLFYQKYFVKEYHIFWWCSYVSATASSATITILCHHTFSSHNAYCCAARSICYLSTRTLYHLFLAWVNGCKLEKDRNHQSCKVLQTLFKKTTSAQNSPLYENEKALTVSFHSWLEPSFKFLNNKKWWATSRSNKYCSQHSGARLGCRKFDIMFLLWWCTSAGAACCNIYIWTLNFLDYYSSY